MKTTLLKIRNIAIIAILGYFILSILWNKATMSTTEAVITKTETKVIEGKDTYMIYTDKGVYRNADQWLEFKINSSNIYSVLIPKERYKITSTGIRSTWFSKYPNILKVELLTPPDVSRSAKN